VAASSTILSLPGRKAWPNTQVAAPSVSGIELEGHGTRDLFAYLRNRVCASEALVIDWNKINAESAARSWDKFNRYWN